MLTLGRRLGEGLQIECDGKVLKLWIRHKTHRSGEQMRVDLDGPRDFVITRIDERGQSQVLDSGTKERQVKA